LRTIILPEQGGKAAALNQGIAAATGEILLFIDIRPKVAPGALAELMSNFADSTVGCVAGELVAGETHDDQSRVRCRAVRVAP
jgi:cellulose synthase/poly-beta-1,6-N-acetylglucosamine synthase-like glycosyltransferase